MATRFIADKTGYYDLNAAVAVTKGEGDKAVLHLGGHSLQTDTPYDDVAKAHDLRLKDVVKARDVRLEDDSDDE